MAHWADARWQGSFDLPSRHAQRSGRYRTYIPDALVARPLVVDAELSNQSARVESAVRGLLSGQGANGLEALSRFLLRSEAMASSRIEGLQASAQQVALAELAQAEHLSQCGFSESARLVANNIVALRAATTDLAGAPAVSVAGIAGLHQALLPQHDPPVLRTVQNWIGGNDWNPLGADFVPPPAPEVPALMSDLAAYINGAVHAPLIQAGIAHAQFETTHPFTDGNGRVGRALVHTVLARRGLTRAAVLPVSLVLLNRHTTYVEGLTAYRYDGPADGPAARTGISAWLATFLDAVESAVTQARQFADDLAQLRADWAERHATSRREKGRRQRARVDSAVARLLDMLPDAPVVTARTVERLLHVSFPAARKALDELVAAGILHSRRVDRGTDCYLARDVFDLLTLTEGRLASTRWDTSQAKPARPVPAGPARVH